MYYILIVWFWVNLSINSLSLETFLTQMLFMFLISFDLHGWPKGSQFFAVPSSS